MKERLLEFLKAENKSSAQFAEEIGVQPSGISHILSGRNKPSLDFVIKMLEKYKFLSTDWLLFGKGTMYRENSVQTLFDNLDPVRESNNIISEPELHDSKSVPGIMEDKEIRQVDKVSKKFKDSPVRRIVWFYDNNSFEEFYPENS